MSDAHGAPQQHDQHQHAVVDEPRASLFSNLVAIVGLIILIVVVIWGLLHLVTLSQGWFSSLFNSGPKITVTAPKQINSGETFTVSWKNSSTDKGNYALLFQCKNGLEMKSNGGAIPCGTAYTIGNTTSVSLTPTLQNVATTSVPVTVVFLPSSTSSERIQGSATIQIQNANVATAGSNSSNTSKTPAQTSKPSTNTSNSSNASSGSTKPATTDSTAKTPADLSVRIVAIGVIDPVSGQFVNRPAMPGELSAAQFDIANVGGTTSGTYYFSANLPTNAGYIYNAPAQSPLAPGAHVLNTLRWSDSAQYGTFTITVTGDKSTGNNYASQTIGSSYYVPMY